jgi:hypothetical protein
MLTTTARRLAATAALTLAALLLGGAGTALGAIAVSVDSPLGGTLAEGQVIGAGRLAQASVDVAFGHVPSTGECTTALAGLTATVDWGDGSPAESLTASDHRASGLDVCTIDLQGAQHRYVLSRPQPYVITVTVSHGGLTSSGTRDVRVVDVPFRGEATNQTAVAGQALSATLGEIRDENEFSTIDQFSATIDWGDGSASPATLTLDRAGRYRVVGTHTYVQPGTYLLVIRVTHAGQTVALDPANVIVAAPGAPAATGGGAPSLTPGGAALSPAFALRSSRARLRTLRSRGLVLRIGLGEFAGRTIRLDIRGTRRGRTRTLATTRLGLRRARLVHAQTRTFDIRWKPSARLLRKLALRTGRSYGLRIRFGNTTLQDTLAIRR